MPTTKPHQHAIVLDAMPGTRREIADKTGLPLGVVRNSTIALSAQRRAHVSGYVPPTNGGSQIPYWVRGHARGFTPLPPLPKETPDDDREHKKAMRNVHLHIAEVLAGPKAHWASSLGVPLTKGNICQSSSL